VAVAEAHAVAVAAPVAPPLRVGGAEAVSCAEADAEEEGAAEPDAAGVAHVVAVPLRLAGAEAVAHAVPVDAAVALRVPGAERVAGPAENVAVGAPVGVPAPPPVGVPTDEEEAVREFVSVTDVDCEGEELVEGGGVGVPSPLGVPLAAEVDVALVEPHAVAEAEAEGGVVAVSGAEGEGEGDAGAVAVAGGEPVGDLDASPVAVLAADVVPLALAPREALPAPPLTEALDEALSDAQEVAVAHVDTVDVGDGVRIMDEVALGEAATEGVGNTSIRITCACVSATNSAPATPVLGSHATPAGEEKMALGPKPSAGVRGARLEQQSPATVVAARVATSTPRTVP
jgi:hypothetical protein